MKKYLEQKQTKIVSKENIFDKRDGRKNFFKISLLGILELKKNRIFKMSFSTFESI